MLCRTDALRKDAFHTAGCPNACASLFTADPVTPSVGKVQESRLVGVAEVAGLIPAVADALRASVIVFVIALEVLGADLVDDLADGLIRIEHTRLPVVLGLIAAITFELMFVLAGSVVLPVTALVLNALR